MIRSALGRIVACALVFLATSCRPSLSPPPPPLLGDPMDAAPATLAPAQAPPWMRDHERGLLVQKARRILILYRKGRVEKAYRVVLGAQPEGPKLHEGDFRTPTGLYRIAAKSPHRRWSRFMLISYPSSLDITRHRLALARGSIPVVEGHRPGPGGAIGIHGTDREKLNERGIDWTWGCISLGNREVEELYELVPVGTPIKIEE